MASTVASRWKRFFKWWLPGFSALGVLLILGWDFYNLFETKRSIRAPRYLISKRALEKGASLSFLDLSYLNSVPSTEIEEGSLTDQDLHLLKGAKLRVSIPSGKIITLGDLVLGPQVIGLGRAIPRGSRAYLIVTPHSVKVRAGDYIDVVFVPQAAHQQPFTLISGASVLQAHERKGLGEYLVVVRVSDIEVLEKARQHGKLRIVLRNPEEPIPLVKHRTKAPWRRKRKKVKSSKVEVLEE